MIFLNTVLTGLGKEDTEMTFLLNKGFVVQNKIRIFLYSLPKMEILWPNILTIKTH